MHLGPDYLLSGFKTAPESFCSCWAKPTFALSRVNPAKLMRFLLLLLVDVYGSLLIASVTKRSTVGRCHLPSTLQSIWRRLS